MVLQLLLEGYGGRVSAIVVARLRDDDDGAGVVLGSRLALLVDTRRLRLATAVSNYFLSSAVPLAAKQLLCLLRSRAVIRRLHSFATWAYHKVAVLAHHLVLGMLGVGRFLLQEKIGVTET